MRIKNITLNNFRIYRGSNNIDLSTKGEKNIIIVSGKNGYGKTTFLMSLVWSLYGKNMSEVDVFYKQQIANYNGYPKYISSSLNRLARLEKETRFYVSITFIDVDIQQVPCKEITIRRSYDIESSNPESLEILFDGQVNELINEYGKDHFIRDFILPLEAAKFFFFDAEKIVSLAEANEFEQMKELSKAYSEVLGIQKYENLITNLEDVQLRFKRDSATKEERKKLIDLKAEEDKNQITITDSNKKIIENREKIDDLRGEIRQIQETLIRQNNQITTEQLDDLHKRSDEIEIQIANHKEEINKVLELAPFAISGDLLMQVSDQSTQEIESSIIQYKDEEVNEKTEKILNELDELKVNQSLTIAQKVQDFYIKSFRNLIRKHFFDLENETSVLPIKLHDLSDIERIELSTLIGNLKETFKNQFKNITKEYNSLLAEKNSISKKLSDAESKEEDEMIKHYRTQKLKLETEIGNKDCENEELLKIVGATDNEQNQIKSQISGLMKKIDTADMYRDKDELAKEVTSELKEFIIKYKDEKKKSLEQKILSGLDTLMHKKIVKKVDVKMLSEHIDIRLLNNRGEEIPKESLSMGEKQLYATSLLKALVEESNIDFPLFVDSPMQKFDEDHAENIIKHFYPNISDQVVIFPILKKELSQDEFLKLKKNIAKCYLIDNIGQDHSKFKEISDNKLFETYNKMYRDEH